MPRFTINAAGQLCDYQKQIDLSGRSTLDSALVLLNLYVEQVQILRTEINRRDEFCAKCENDSNQLLDSYRQQLEDATTKTPTVSDTTNLIQHQSGFRVFKRQ